MKNGLDPIPTEEEEREIREREKRERLSEERLYSAEADDGDGDAPGGESEGEDKEGQDKKIESAVPAGEEEDSNNEPSAETSAEQDHATRLAGRCGCGLRTAKQLTNRRMSKPATSTQG